MKKKILKFAAEAHALPAGLCLLAFTYAFGFSHPLRLEALLIAGLAGVFAASILLGRTIACLMPVPLRGIAEYPTIFLLGFYALCAFLLVFSFTSPFPIVVNFLVVLALAIISQWLVNWRGYKEIPEGESTGDSIAVVVAVIIATWATLIWTSPQRHIYVVEGASYVFPQWVDMFVHSAIISIFSEASGCTDLQRPWMAGVGLFPYHFAVYPPSSFLVGLSHFSPVEVYSCFFLPSAYLIAGFSAYVLARQWWSAEASAAATAGIMLIPDSSWQGLIGDYHYGFYWILQAVPGLGIGLGLLALAWATMLAACQKGSLAGVLGSFVFEVMLIPFKFQLFVGTAVMVWFFPIFFLKSISLRWRLIWLAVALSLFDGAVWLGSHHQGLPPVGITADGIVSIGYWIMLLHVPMDHFIVHLMAESLFLALVIACAYLVLAVLGWWSSLWLILTWVDPTSRRPLSKLLFVPLVVVNFIVHNLTLTSVKSIVIYDEFSHRPFVWPYLVVVTFVSANLYVLLVEKSDRKDRRLMAVIVAACCFIFPTLLDQRIINPVRWDEVTNTRVDKAFLACARFIQENSRPGDIIEDIDTDPHLALPAWTGQREWVSLIYPWNKGAKCHNPECVDRLNQVKAWSEMTDETQIREFAARGNIRWVIIDPDASMGWPHTLLNQPVFTDSGYKVIRLN